VIHPTAVIHPAARVDATAHVGPFCVIDEDVELGAECILGPHVYLTGRTVIGRANRFHAGTIIGDAPQDLKYRGEQTRVRIGDNNIFREHVTVHRSATTDAETAIGSNNYLMQHCHVAHNSRLGDYVILGGGALLAGYASVDDRAFISGNCLVHQFVRIGSLAMMQGGSAISKDLPPFAIVTGRNRLCGMNAVGMRRANIASADRLQVRKAYHAIFRAGKNIRDAATAASTEFTTGPAAAFIKFIAESKRGVCAEQADRAVPED
jgi:UDP-N-acetylglucosamine acyltransferase